VFSRKGFIDIFFFVVVVLFVLICCFTGRKIKVYSYKINYNMQMRKKINGFNTQIERVELK